MELDMREFNRAAEECIKESERTYPEFINGHLLAIASKAIPATDKANADQIAHEMGQIGTKVVRSRKTGQLKKGRRIYATGDTMAARIVNARRKRQGLPLVWGAELDREAKYEIARRLRAVAFIRSGWIYAVRTLSRLVGYKTARPNQDVRMSGQAKGYARPAQRVFNSTCEGEIANTALLTDAVRPQFKSGHSSNPMPVATRGLQIAVNEEQRDMLEHLAQKLRPVFAKHSA